MQNNRLMAAIAAVLIGASAAAVAGERQDVNGVTILRGKVATGQQGNGVGGANTVVGSGGGTYRADQSGAINSVVTGSANAGGEFNNLPPGAGR